jgi:hypothetical protein
METVVAERIKVYGTGMLALRSIGQNSGVEVCAIPRRSAMETVLFSVKASRNFDGLGELARCY